MHHALHRCIHGDCIHRSDHYPQNRGLPHRPALNVMDSDFFAAVKKYIRAEKINIQLVPPHNHRVNTAEHAITTFKEYFIAALATVDMLCPLQLWDEFLLQVELTLNMLRFSRRNPKKSANQEVYGSFDFNKFPLAPLCRPSRFHQGQMRAQTMITAMDFEEESFGKQELSGPDFLDLGRQRFFRETPQAMTSLSETFLRKA